MTTTLLVSWSPPLLDPFSTLLLIHTYTYCIYYFLQQWFSDLGVHQIQLEAY